MFKQLKNEAKIDLALTVETPLHIWSGEQNVLDPSLPDNQVLRQYKDGQFQVVIPGSSLKGVFRSRAEQLLAGMGYQVDSPFDRKSPSAQAKGDGMSRYQQSCPVSQLFGSLSLKSRIFFADAYPVDPAQVATGLRHNVAINRVTGGAQRGSLFDKEVVEAGSFHTQITLQNFELWQLSLILWLIRDLDQGYMRLGASTSRGLGKVSAQVQQVLVRSYENIELTQAPIQGYFEGDETNREVSWTKGIIDRFYVNGDLDHWIGEDGLLQGVRWPDKDRVLDSSVTQRRNNR